MLPVSNESVHLNDRQKLENKLGEIAEKIETQGEKRQFLAKILKKAKKESKIPIDTEKQNIIEPELTKQVKKHPLKNIKIAGVDGGVLNKPLHGLDLILVRAVVAIFQYKNKSLNNSKYYPNEKPVPKLINIHEPLDSRELDTLVGMRRQLTELDKAKKAVQKHEVDALMLDGSVVPQYSNRSTHETTQALYKKLTKTFTKLYKTCREKNILLIGSVKDSRSSRLTKAFRKTILPKFIKNTDLPYNEVTSLEEKMSVLKNSRDTAFLDHLLDEGERTFTFKYSEAPANLLEDLGDWKKKIHAFYTKPVPYDRPVRVEFISNIDNAPEKADRIASIVDTLSASHKACALPSVLIEADARARLTEEEIGILRDNISDRLDPSTMLDLRSERRPFR